MKKLLSTLAFMVVAVAFATSALAEEREKFEPAQRAIAAAGVNVVRADMGKDYRGRDALIVKTDWEMPKLVDNFLELLKTGKDLEGHKVVGLAHITHSDTWNVTLRAEDKLTTCKISRDDKGSKITIRKPRKDNYER